MYYGSTGLEDLTMNQLRERIASVSLELKDLELDPHKNSLKIAQVKIRKSNLVAEMMKRQGAVVVQGQATSKGKASNEVPVQQPLSMDEINTLKTTADEFKNISSITNAEIEQSLNLVIEPLGAMFNGYWTKLPLTDKLYIQSAIINGFIAMQTKLNRPIAMPASFPKEVIDVYISLPPFQPQEASEQPIQMVKTQPQPSASTVQPIAQDKPALLPFEPTMDTTFVGRGPSMLTTTAPAGYGSDLKTKMKTQIVGTLAVASLIGYSIGKKYNQPVIGAFIGAYIPTLIAGNFARPNISLTRGITEFTQTLSK